MQVSMICKLLGHSFNKQPDKVENRPCDKWDDCNIKEHRFDLSYFYCNRCSLEKKLRC